jgi:hypothetical protein
MTTAKKDPEVEAMGIVAGALDGLEDEVQARVLRWAGDRYGVSIGGKRQGSGGDSRKDVDLGEGGDPSEYAELSDLFSAAAPATDEDRALVVAYWFQEGQEEKQANVTGQQVNKELKNLGHGVRDITKVFNTLIATSPQQVIQTRKSGSSRQARKNYKVTKVGIRRVEELLANAG